MTSSQSQPGFAPSAASANAAPSAVERLTSALAIYDAHVAKCPVNNYAVDRRAYGPKDTCSVCGALASGNCGKDATASYHLVREVRAIVGAERG